MNRRKFLFTRLPSLAQSALLASLATTLNGHAMAETASAQTLTLIVPFPAGGASDALARQIAPHLAHTMGQTVVVENVTGASGSLAARKMLSAAPDGNHIMVVSSSETIMPPLLLSSARFQPEDFRLLISPLAVPLALVGRPGLKPPTLEALLAHSRDPVNKPLSYGSFGNGTIPHLAAAHFEQLTGTSLLHVPYRGGAPLITDLLGEQVDLSFFPFAGNLLQLAETGQIRVYGIASATRLPQLAKYAVLGEHAQLKGFVHTAWNSLAVSKSVPEAAAERLSHEIYAILQRPEIAAFVAKMGSVMPDRANLAEVEKFYRAETRKLRLLAKAVDLKAQ